MSSVYDLLHNAGSHNLGAEWFAAISDLLLNESVVVFGGRRYRLVEIEYYYNGPEHEDPFAHGDDVQKTTGKWYFHRSDGTYRGGSFKGLDITFGGDGVVGGILIRSMESLEDDTFINGSCLCVNHMLDITGYAKVAEYDQDINWRDVYDASSPLHIVHDTSLERREVLATGRVGLTLKRAYQHKTMPEYIMKPYRFLTEFRNVKKGKVHTNIALYKQGLDVEAINAKTKTPKGTLNTCVAAFEEGKERTSFRAFYGKSLKNADLCTLHGMCAAQFGD